MRTEERIKKVTELQKSFFKTGKTLDISFRMRQLTRLKKAVLSYEEEILQALRKDLGRSETEAYFCDVGTVVMEINEILKDLKKWAKPETHFSGFAAFPSVTTKVYKMPYGTVLIISPFNYPFLLSLGVLAAAIAGGNTAVIKASSKSTACTKVLMKLIAETFPEKYIAVIDGGHDAADLCLAQRFDKIFYTGSPKVGKHVMAEAAKNLTPVTLELGGETGNWCIVRADADLKDAARKIAFFKMCNSGQICININQVAVAEEAAEAFLSELKAAFLRQMRAETEIFPVTSNEYPCLINDAAYRKCEAEAERYRDRIVFGGYGNAETKQYAPTVIYPVGTEEEIVNHELFNPLLPVVPFKDAEIDRLLDVIQKREHGLAFYIFTGDVRWAKRVMASSQYGGGCINEVCLHLIVKGVPFGGTGHSGMGAYHGEWGFREFTHPSTVLIGKRRGNLPLREHPYEGKRNAWKKTMLRLFER